MIASDHRHCGTTFAAIARIATPIIATFITIVATFATTGVISAMIAAMYGTMCGNVAAGASQNENERLGHIRIIRRSKKAGSVRAGLFFVMDYVI